MHKKITPIILCGGSGTRLLPFLDVMMPKQFLYLIHHKYNLLQGTIARFKNRDMFNPPILVASNSHYSLIKQSMLNIDHDIDDIIFEHESRNTGPAIALAISHMMHLGHACDTPVIVAPIDHYMADNEIFMNRVKYAMEHVQNIKKLLAFTVTPTSMESNYGYLKIAQELSTINTQPSSNIYDVIDFIEKPSIDVIQTKLRNSYVWNSGIYCMTIDICKNMLMKKASEMWFNSSSAMSKARKYSNKIDITIPSIEHCKQIPAYLI